jgi:ribosomal protein S18 acetylase RimI-like enzyme
MNEMNLTYEKVDADNMHIVAVLAEKIWKKHYITIISAEQIEYMLKNMYSPESLLAQMKSGHEFTLAMLDGKAVGYMSLSSKDNKNYFLHKFYIDISEQAKGIGTAFFKSITERLKNVRSIELTVNRKNFTAINFYFKNGFKIKEVADFNIGKGYFMNDFVMIKKFEP